MSKSIDHCKDCVSWTPEKDEYDPDGFGNCSNDCFTYGSISEDVTPSTLFLYIDSEAYGANFSTHKNFGCVAFKRRLG